jgi:NAD(P)-dependent dehydrogenase (short-subunit alcohol dehydrogenase family)
MDLQLANKLALISGSTAGIGFAIARALADEGARVIVNGRTADGVDDAVGRIASTTGSTVYGFAGDLSVASTATELARQHPGVEILVNNMGVFEPKPFEEIPDEDWRRFFEVNVLTASGSRDSTCPR